MSDQSQEPENYTIDAMMDRLKERASESQEEGELVTRSDGSVALKVRKHKRRSRQPHKEHEHRERKLRAVQVTVLLVSVMLVIFTGGGILVYHNMPAFRNSLTEKISAWTGAQAELTQFRATPIGCSAASIALHWPESGILKELSARGVVGDLSLDSFFRSKLSGEEMLAEEVSLRVDQAGAAPAVKPSSLPADAECPFDFRYRANKFHAVFGESLKPCVRLHDSEASFYRRDMSGTGELRINQGTLSVRDWQDFTLDRSLLEFHAGKIQVIGFRLLDPTNGKGSVELKGEIDPSDHDRPSDLELKVEGVALSQVGGKNLAGLLDGRVNSRDHDGVASSVKFVPGDFSSLRVVLFYESNPGSRIALNGFAFLKNLARLAGDDWYEHPSFDAESSGVITRQDGGVNMEDLKLEAKNRLSIRGSLRLDRNDRLSGVFEVGIPEELIRSMASESVKRAFPDARDGFRWAKIRLSGTGAQPLDTLHDELANTAPRKVDAPSEAPPADPQKEFENITRPH
jgi:hypothetical protein